MKILHVSTSDAGGAANAAIRLHHGLLNQNIHSTYLTLHSFTKNVKQHVQHSYNIKEKFLERLRLKFRIEKYQNEKKQIRNLIQEGAIDTAHFPFSNFDITTQKEYQEADIINLHWVNNYLNPSSFFEKNTKPTIWTLHDMYSFSGVCHYQVDYDRSSSLHEIDAIARKIKQKAYQKAKLEIVCPSKWLLNKSMTSDFFSRFSHHYIPYSLNTNIFKLQNQYKAREELNLPQDKKIALFVSQRIKNYRKGFDLLREAIGVVNNITSNLHVVAIGNKQFVEDSGIHYLGSIKNETEMAKAYAAADVFILPSREDNLPNVMLESLACGTPVISFPTGGMLDTIDNGINGFLCSEISVKSLVETIQKWMSGSDSFIREKISEEAKKLYTEESQAIKYIKLYKSMLESF
ncbi:glycosyltransferase [Catalinimonas niigatensis]|uniref:glycosyltransferase n=1 Tax=Catalinimonas niigatensis TaxID=1397264 RepID=UPI0026652D54|nr:glycosyltransferase [Catalinimonas niigatensis]WPP52619.1 glycosyltransferase [Catalinimonas niigatensis]